MKSCCKLLNCINFFMLTEFLSPEHVLPLQAKLCFCRRWNCVTMLSFGFTPCFAPSALDSRATSASILIHINTHQKKNQCIHSEWMPSRGWKSCFFFPKVMSYRQGWLCVLCSRIMTRVGESSAAVGVG